MKLIVDLLSSLIPIVAPIGVGYLSRKMGLFNSDQATLFRTLAVRVTVPFLIFKTLYKADLADVSQALPIIVGFLTISLLYAVSGFTVAKSFYQDIRRRSSYVFGTFVGNYAFLGWSVLYLFWGEEALTRAVFFSVFFWPGFLLIGFSLVRALKSKEQNERAPIGRLLISNALLPFATVVLALLCNHWRIVPPKSIWMVIEQFSGITVPLILFAVGLSLRIKMPGHDVKVVAMATVHRLLFGGVIGWLVASLAGLIFSADPLTQKVVFLQATMPTATMSPFFAEYCRMDERLLGSIIAISTLFSLLTLPLWRLVLDAVWR